MSEEPDWSVEERDRIAAMDRGTLIQTLCEGDADCDFDDNTFQVHYERHRDGMVGRIYQKTMDLRNELYDLEDIPAGERQYTVEEQAEATSSIMTVGDLIIKLMQEAQESKDWTRGPEDFARWRVMMRFDINGDVIVGAGIASVKQDGFHQHVNLIGKTEED